MQQHGCSSSSEGNLTPAPHEDLALVPDDNAPAPVVPLLALSPGAVLPRVSPEAAAVEATVALPGTEIDNVQAVPNLLAVILPTEEVAPLAPPAGPPQHPKQPHQEVGPAPVDLGVGFDAL